MEQEFNQITQFEQENLNYFKLQYQHQNVKHLPQFQKWYEKTNKYINEENNKRTLRSKNNFSWEDNHDILFNELHQTPKYNVNLLKKKF